MSRFASQTDNDVSRHVGMAGETGQSSIELLVIQAAILHGTTRFVRNRDHTIHVGEWFEEFARANSICYVLARACRAIHRRKEGDKIPRAKAAIATIVSFESSAFGPHGRWWAIAAECVVPFESVRGHIMNVHMFAGNDGLTSEANDLAIFGNGFALGDICQRNLMPKADLLRH